MLGLILLLVLKVCSSNAVEAISGSDTTITCPLTGSSFQWQRLVNGKWPTLQQGAKYGNVNTASLIMYNVDPSDGGHYVCKADAQERYIIVTVIVIAIEGSTTTLTCPLQSTSFIWIKHTTPNVSKLQQGAKYGGVNTRHLAIYNVDPHDGGLYTCRTTDVPPHQKTMNVVFRAIARWGSTITLTCTLPGSNYYWQKRTDANWSSRIQAGAKYGNVNSELMTINNVQTNDGGRYRCGINAALEQVDVSVIEIPRVKTTTYETTVDDNSSAAIGIGSTAVVVGLLILSIYIM